MKKVSLLLVLLVFFFTVSAQDKREERKERKEAKRAKINDLIRQAEEGGVVYEKQNIFGVQLRTNGYGIFYEHGRMKSARKTNIFRIDLTEIKSANEEKSASANFFFGNPYIYGKINYFYPLTIGMGQQYILGQKGNKNGVAVSAVYTGGISIGLLRPYYVSIQNSMGEEETIKYTPEDSTNFVNGPHISGGGLGKGWGEMKIRPGAFVKGALRFDWGRFNETVSGIEIGISADFYPSKVPIMLFQKERQFFVQGHIALLFGKRK